MVASSVRGMDLTEGQLSEHLACLRDVLVEMAGEDLQGVDSGSLLADVAGMRRLVDQVEGEWLRRVGEVHARGAADAVGAGSTKAFLRGTCLLSPFEASRAVNTATALRGPCAATAVAVAQGRIGVGQAQVITTVLGKLPSALPQGVRVAGEAVLLEHAGVLNPADLARAGRFFASRVDPDGVARDEAEQAARSGITFSSTVYGAGFARGDLDAESLAVIVSALEPMSAPAPHADGHPDMRTAARRRLDALVVIAAHWLDCQTTPDARRPAAHLTVITNAATLQARPGAGGSSLEWGGVISVEATRRLACDASITPVTVGPLGQVLDVGRRTRVVTPGIWAGLVVRDGGCAFPGCDAPVSRCDAHHVVHWADGGPTALGNLVLVCQYHHHRVLHSNDDDTGQADWWRVSIDGPTGRPVFTPPTWTRRRGIPLPPLRQPLPWRASDGQLMDGGPPPDG